MEHRDNSDNTVNTANRFADFSRYMAEELTLNEQTLPVIAQIANHLPGGFFIYKAYGDEEILYINEYMLHICGCADREQFRTMTGNSFRGFVYSDDYEKSECAIRSCIDRSDNNLDYVEYRIRRYDGSIRWIMDYGRLAHTEKYGNVFCVFVDDSTDKNLRAEEDRRATQVIRGLSEEYNSIYLIDFELRKMLPYSLNNEVAKSMQYAFSNSLDYETTIREFADRYVIPADYEMYLEECSEQRIRSRLLTEKSYSVIFRRYNEKRVQEYIRMTISRVDEEGRFSRIVMGYKDVTEQVKKAQEEQRLLEAAQKADAANRAKTTFLFNMSHDIRTPMNAIIGFSELALKHMDDRDRIEEYLRNIGASGKHLLNLINNVLEMSRIESGNLELEEKPDDLLGAAGEWATIFREEASEKGLTLHTASEIEHTLICWDGTKVEEIFLNIVNNAIKYTPAGGTVSISLKELASDREGYARYETVVEDTGIGISEEFIPHIFESFSRERNSTESRVMGTGLGMGIVKRLLDMMGGDIHIESSPGKGTRVTVLLEHRLCEKEALPESSDKYPDAEDTGLQGMHILLAEDNELNREIAEELLNDAGADVTSAADGAICVEMLDRAEPGRYGVVLMDIQMPNVDGLTATRMIRKLPDPEKARIPILAMTANAFEEDKQKAAEAGMDGFIAKPVKVEQLITELVKIRKEG